MNFIDRTALGDMLAERLHQFYGKDAVVVCLQESSLLTCLTIASQIRAWIYPLVYAPVYTSGQEHQLLGAYGQDGDFCPLPGGPADVKDGMPAETKADIKKQRTAAMRSVKKQKSDYGLALDKRGLDGRDVILTADVITSMLPLAVAQQLLKGVSPKSLSAVVGNATPEVARLVRISAGKSDILDILSGVYFDEDRYFERSDSYTSEQKHTLTQHIATYWQ